MAKLTPEEHAEKQARRLKGSLEDIRRGVQRVKESPTKRAALKKDKFRNNLLESIDNGKWEAGLNAVTLDSWQKDMLDKGVNHIAAGIDGAKAKVAQFAQRLNSFQDSLAQELERMPDLTLEDRLNRATFWMRKMSTFKNK